MLPPVPSRKANGLALTALIVGIVAFLIGWTPFFGFLVGVAAVVAGISALYRGQSKPLAITGTVLGAIGLITSLLISIGLVISMADGGSSRPVEEPPAAVVPDAPTEAAEEPATETEPEAPEPAPEPEAPATPDLTSFAPTDDRTFALIAKDPDAHVGSNLIIFGDITQLDSATGRCNALVSTAATQKENSFDYEQNSLASSGDFEVTCPVFDPLVEDDHVKMWVTVLGSFSYETQIGGNTTVPHFEVWQAELLPAMEY